MGFEMAEALIKTPFFDIHQRATNLPSTEISGFF